MRDGLDNRGAMYDEENPHQLERVWKVIRNFFSLDNEARPGLDHPREAFRKACERYADNKTKSVLSIEKVKQAFNAAFFSPMLTDDQFH